LNSSLNVELVHIILKSITENCGRHFPHSKDPD